jgi:glutamate-ammonia-ligase adenylyltransferase
MEINPHSSAPQATSDYSRFVQRIRRRYGAASAILPAGILDRTTIEQLITALLGQGYPLAAAMRMARQWVLERLVVLDIDHQADLTVVISGITQLAEVTMNLALTQARLDADAKYGALMDAQGQVIELWVIGMGKLGGRELNVSSDIDVVYIYTQDGQSTGPLKVSAEEYFADVIKRIYALIGEVNDDGFVFRLDGDLRPHGRSGPPAVSLSMLEDYLQTHGREWERFAWLKSRVIAPQDAIVSGSARALTPVVQPFVYRKYLDYGVFEALRELHRRIRSDAHKRALGRPERANDVKLGRGGIREIEFIVQLLMVVRGGQYPEIRSRSTLKGLSLLANQGLIPQDVALALQDAYVLLRRLEHRIQYLDDQQTHVLPTQLPDLWWIQSSLGLGHAADAGALLERYESVREMVAYEFDALLHDKTQSISAKNSDEVEGFFDSFAWLNALDVSIQDRWNAWVSQPKIQALKDSTKRVLTRLLDRVWADCQDAQRQNPELLLQFAQWIEPLLRREAYLNLLIERTKVRTRLLHLLQMARWPMRYLMKHPGVIDELADERQLADRFDAKSFRQEMMQRYAGWLRTGELHEEELLNALRHAYHAEVFRTLVREAEGKISVEKVADDLSGLADVLLDLALHWAWASLKQRRLAGGLGDDMDVNTPPKLAIIAYGKLGGKELGYGSDLDLVFLYDDADERAPELYAALVRKLIMWLTLHTAAGHLFEIDTALRPNGNSGLLVSSMASFANYQSGRGSNTAWTWEHQAITRARWCAGSQPIASAFEAVREQVLCARRDEHQLRLEIQAMREKLRQAYPVAPDKFDIKHSPGGMLDLEFTIQYLVLAYAHQYPELLVNSGNIALLSVLERLHLIPQGMGQKAAMAYREMRRLQHYARLNEQPSLVAYEQIKTHAESLLTLWYWIWGGGTGTPQVGGNNP